MTLKRTGIKRGTKELQRATPLKRTGPLKSKGLIGRRAALKSVRPKRTPEENTGKDVVDKRATTPEGEIVCELWLPCCTWYGSDFHHRRNKGKGGPWDPANGLKACRACHDAVTDTEPEWSYRGWWIEDGEDWLTKPVFRRHQWVLLDNAGGRTPCPPPERAAVAS